MLRVVLIGCGKWGINYISSIKEVGLGKVTKIVTTADLMSQAMNGHLTSSSDEDLEQLLLRLRIDRDNYDAAIIATHPPTTERYALALLNLGISVMVEKPFTFNHKTLDRIDTLLSKSTESLTFLINHQHLFSSAIEFISHNFRDQKISFFESEAGGVGPFREYSPLCDYGPHDLSIFTYLTGTCPQLVDFQSERTSIGCSEAIRIKDENGCVGSMSFWNNRPPKTHRILMNIGVEQILFDDFDPFGKVKIGSKYQALPWRPPLSQALSAFLTRISEKSRSNDRRFNTYLSKLYIEILNRSGSVHLNRSTPMDK
jgi:predicted dehydrogenase